MSEHKINVSIEPPNLTRTTTTDLIRVWATDGEGKPIGNMAIMCRMVLNPESNGRAEMESIMELARAALREAFTPKFGVQMVREEARTTP